MAYRDNYRRSRVARLRQSTARLRRSIAIVVKERPANYFMVTFILVSVIFQITADVTSGWLVIDVKRSNPNYNESIDLELGLIYVKHCFEGECTTELVDKFDHEKYGVSDDDLLEYRIEAGVGLLSAILTTAFTCRLACCNGKLAHKRCVLITIGTLSAISGAAVGCVAGRFGSYILDHHQSLGEDSPHKPPYSIILVAVGGMLALLTTITAIIELCRTFCCDSTMTAGDDDDES